MNCSTGPCPLYLSTKCVYYAGSNLICTGIKTNDRLDVILEKIDEALCAGGGGGGTTYINAGLNIDVDGVGTLSNPYTISSTLVANNGLILTGNAVKLGQTVGASGNPAVLLVNTEIPLGDHTLALNNKSGTGVSASSITFSTTNSLGYSFSGTTISAADQAVTIYSVNNITGNMESRYLGSVGTLQGSSGYALSGGGGYFYLSNMKGGTTHSTVQVGDVDSQNWNVNGDTLIGLFGTKNTGFGGQANPTASIDIAPALPQKAQLRFRGGSTPPLLPNEGDTWYDESVLHLYSYLGGQIKQLDNDYNFTPDTFIQNQFIQQQPSSNYWISGHARIDDYITVNNSSRITKDAAGNLAITSSSSNTVAGDVRVGKLKFWSGQSPFTGLNSAYIAGSQNVDNGIDIVSESIYFYGKVLSFQTTGGVSDLYPLIDVGGNHPLKIQSHDGVAGEFAVIDLWNSNTPGSAASGDARIKFSGQRTTGGKTKFGQIGTDVTDDSNTLYKADLVFETVDATINSGNLTEYFRIKNNGNLIAKSLDTDGTAPTTTGTTKMVISDSIGLLSFIDVPVPGTPNIPISILTPALGSNTIDNTSFQQAWNWSTLQNQVGGLRLTTTATNASGSGQAVLFVGSSGAQNNGIVISTSSAVFNNTHTGVLSTNIGISASSSGAGLQNKGVVATGLGSGSTNFGVQATASGSTATNYALYASASGGTDNYALYADTGDIYVNDLANQTAPTRIVTQIAGTKVLGYITAGTGITISGGTISASTAGLQGIQSVLDTDNVLTSGTGIDGGGVFDFEFTNLAGFSLQASGLTQFRIANFGSASNGDVLTLVDNITGEVGWSAGGGGGGGVSSFSAGNLSPLFTSNVATATSTPALTFSLTNAGANTYFGNSTGGATAPSYIAAGALTTVNDTNITLTAGGNASTSLLRAASITVSWAGTLATSRGGTGLGVLGTANQLLRVNAGATALEYFTPSYISSALTTLNTLTASTQTFATGTTGTDFNISSATSTHTFNIPDAGLTSRGVVTTSAQSFEGVKTFNVGVVVNESGASTDFRVESDTNTNALFVQGSTNRVGIFTASPAYPLDVTGNTQILSGALGIGTAPTTASPLVLGGSGWTSSGLILLPSISATAGSSPSIIGVTGTIIEAGSGTHAIIAGVNISAPTITSGLATVTNAASLYIAGQTAATVTGANYSILVNSGVCRFNGDFQIGTGTSYSSGGYDSLVRNQTTGRLEILDTGLVGFRTAPGTAETLQLSDKDGMVLMTNSSASTLTIPANASVAFPIGAQILVKAKGTGQVTISPAVGVSIEAADGALKSRVQFSVITLIKEGTNLWTAAGDLTT